MLWACKYVFVCVCACHSRASSHCINIRLKCNAIIKELQQKLNRTERNNMPLHRWIYVNVISHFSEKISIPHQNFLRMHESELPSRTSISVGVLCKTKFLRWEYNSWNNIEEIHRRRRQTHFNAQIQTTIHCSHCHTAVVVVVIVVAITLAFAMAKFLISKQGWFDVWIESDKTWFTFQTFAQFTLGNASVCGTFSSSAFVSINLIKISTASDTIQHKLRRIRNCVQKTLEIYAENFVSQRTQKLSTLLIYSMANIQKMSVCVLVRIDSVYMCRSIITILDAWTNAIVHFLDNLHLVNSLIFTFTRSLLHSYILFGNAYGTLFTLLSLRLVLWPAFGFITM